MTSKNIEKIDEIDLLELILTVWSNKWKVILIILVIVIGAFIYQISQQPKYMATTKITPISTFDEFKYEILSVFRPPCSHRVGWTNDDKFIAQALYPSLYCIGPTSTHAVQDYNHWHIRFS